MTMGSIVNSRVVYTLHKNAISILILFYLNALTFVEKYMKNTRNYLISRKYIHDLQNIFKNTTL